jgi:DNA-damage-inducible protein J
MDATVNVRMDAPLKQRGDKVLMDNGVSTSAAVRALWQELARTRELPSFLRQATKDKEAVDKKKRCLAALSGIAEGSLSALSDDELKDIGRERYA